MTSARRVAAIDCGTNSIRLLVADLVDDDSSTQNDPALKRSDLDDGSALGGSALGGGRTRLRDVHREMRVVRLGEGVDATGVLSGAAIERTRVALADYAATLRTFGAVKVRMAATSASRDAANRADFVSMVLTTLGQEPEVVSGEEEAELSFRGAVGDLDPKTGPFLVVDIGGGSTEMVVGSVVHGAVRIAGRVSLDVGCVRITERLLGGDPPSDDERVEAAAWARSILADGLDRLPISSIRRFVPVSGTATTVAAAALQLPSYDPDRIHLSTIGFPRVQEVAAMLTGATRAHRAALPYMHEGRVDVIGGGALILSTLVSLVADRVGPEFEPEITVSEHDILDGLALSMG